MNNLKVEAPRQSSVSFDNDTYLVILDLAKEKKWSISKTINSLVQNGLNNIKDNTALIESMNKKFDKIISKQNSHYNLSVQSFCNHRYAQNFDTKNNVAYQDYLKQIRKDRFND